MSILLSSRLLPSAVPSSMPMFDHTVDQNHQLNPPALPKYFNVPFAVQHGYFRCVRYLLQLDFDPNERDSQLRTPLILCSYVENDRWSLSLAQNLLEKGAKIALEDNARRNAMHHACALQRVHLVQLYLSCLDFNIDAKDCEGNTCLHYAAITGNGTIAELLIRSAEKLGIRLDQFVNREGCSAAILALKYGHIECANQITHRDWDEFFVVPRPLSIYEHATPTDENLARPRKKTISTQQLSDKKADNPPPSFSFGLLKIIFNDGDTNYSSRLAGLCQQDKQRRRHRRKKHDKQEAPQTSTTTINKFDRTKSTLVDYSHHSSTEAVVNETEPSRLIKERQKYSNTHTNLNNSNQSTGHIQLLIPQHPISKLNGNDHSESFIQKATSKTQLSIDDINKIKLNISKYDRNDTKSKVVNIRTTYQETSNSTLTQPDHNASRIKTKAAHPTTSTVLRHQSFANGSMSHTGSAKVKPAQHSLISTSTTTTATTTTTTIKKRLLNDRLDSASNGKKQNQSTVNSDTTAYSQTMYDGRPISALIHRSNSKLNESSCSIRESREVTNRFNKPEELFGVRPEELFAPEQYQPKIIDQSLFSKASESIRPKRVHLQKQQYVWQSDVDKILDLYNVHHCANYRKSAMPPTTGSTEGANDTMQNSRPRRMSMTKNNSTNLKASTHFKPSLNASLNMPRRNSISRPSVK